MQIYPGSPLDRLGRIVRVGVKYGVIAGLCGVVGGLASYAVRKPAAASTPPAQYRPAPTSVARLTETFLHGKVSFKIDGDADSIDAAIKLLMKAKSSFTAAWISNPHGYGTIVVLYGERDRIERDMLGFAMALKEANAKEKLFVVLFETARSTDPAPLTRIVNVTGEPTDEGGQQVWR
jgi:hypothetical protein